MHMTKQQIKCIFERFHQNHTSNFSLEHDEVVIQQQKMISQRSENVTKIKWMNDEKEWRAYENVDRQKIIILFTYHRSGSSFTGQLLNQHPGQHRLTLIDKSREESKLCFCG